MLHYYKYQKNVSRAIEKLEKLSQKMAKQISELKAESFGENMPTQLTLIGNKLKDFSDFQNNDWMQRRIEFWCKIYNKSSIVTENEIRNIWQSMGMDNRGLGGFFVGRNPSLTKLLDGRIALTSKASENILAWTGKEISIIAKEFGK